MSSVNAVQVWQSCMEDNAWSDGAEATCLYAARVYDPNFQPTPTGQTGGAAGFWSDPTNIVNLIGAAGTATGTWLDAFGIGSPQQPAYTPQPQPQQQAGIPWWVWALIAVAVIVIIVLLVKFL